MRYQIVKVAGGTFRVEIYRGAGLVLSSAELPTLDIALAAISGYCLASGANPPKIADIKVV